jgi:hypothetical protein
MQACSQHCQQQQQQGAGIDPKQLTACIYAATTFTQLQAVCNTFLGSASFTSQHTALVLSRLHLVSTRPTDSLLLLVELLAQSLAAACSLQEAAAHAAVPSSHTQQQQQQQQQIVASEHAALPSTQPQQQQQQWLSCGEVSAVCWSFSRAGYQPAPQLLQQLLQQFWLAFGQQQQQQRGTPLPAAGLQPAASTLSTPTRTTLQQQQQQQRAPSAGLQQAAVSTPKTAPQQQQQVWPPREPDEALATLVAGLAGVGCREPGCWRRIRAAVQVALSDSSSSNTLPVHSLQQLAWGFAAVQQADAATVDAVAGALQGRLGELETPEDLVQSMWSLHLMGCTDRKLFEQAAQMMVQQVQRAVVGSSSSSSSSSRILMPRATAAAAAAVGEVQQSAAVLPQLPRTSCRGADTVTSATQLSRLQAVPGQQQQRQRQGSSLLLRRRAPPQQQQQQQRHASPQRLISAAAGQTAALCSAAASQAFGVLNKYDPLLCMLALYRDHYQPAHGV